MIYPCTLNKPDTVYFNETKYRLVSGKKYYLSNYSTTEKRKSVKGLHVAIWEHFNNDIVPKGFHIHHIDSNSFNNRPENLELISKEEHKKIPKNLDLDKARENLNNIRHLTKAWHSSIDGIKWHREHAKNSLLKRLLTIKSCNCINCGETFDSKIERRYCDRSCAEKYRRKNYKKKVEITCIVCSKKTEVEYYDRKPTHCSKKCVGVTAWSKNDKRSG